MIHGRSHQSNALLLLCGLTLLAIGMAALMTGCTDQPDALAPATDDGAQRFQVDPALVIEGQPATGLFADPVAIEGPTGEWLFSSGDRIDESILRHDDARKHFKAGRSGELKLHIDGDVKLRLEDDSLEDDVFMTADLWVKETLSRDELAVAWVLVELQPEAEFEVNATLEVSDKLTTSLVTLDGELLLWRLDGGTWEFAADGELDDKNAVFVLERSGTYALLSFDPTSATELDPDLLAPAESYVRHWFKSKDFKVGKKGKLGLGGGMHLEIGDGAVPTDVTIRGDVWAKMLGRGRSRVVEWVMFEFEPSMEFLEPITLKLPDHIARRMLGDDGKYYLWYLNEASDTWELADVAEVDGKDVCFEVDHFSKYAVGQD